MRRNAAQNGPTAKIGPVVGDGRLKGYCPKISTFPVSGDLRMIGNVGGMRVTVPDGATGPETIVANGRGIMVCGGVVDDSNSTL